MPPSSSMASVPQCGRNNVLELLRRCGRRNGRIIGHIAQRLLARGNVPLLLLVTLLIGALILDIELCEPRFAALTQPVLVDGPCLVHVDVDHRLRGDVAPRISKVAILRYGGVRHYSKGNITRLIRTQRSSPSLYLTEGLGKLEFPSMPRLSTL